MLGGGGAVTAALPTSASRLHSAVRRRVQSRALATRTPPRGRAPRCWPAGRAPRCHHPGSGRRRPTDAAIAGPASGSRRSRRRAAGLVSRAAAQVARRARSASAAPGRDPCCRPRGCPALCAERVWSARSTSTAASSIATPRGARDLRAVALAVQLYRRCPSCSTGLAALGQFAAAIAHDIRTADQHPMNSRSRRKQLPDEIAAPRHRARGATLGSIIGRRDPRLRCRSS